MKATKIIKLVMLGAVIFGLNIGTANAIFINGDMGITGSYTADSTTLTLISATGTSGTGDLGDTVTFGTPGTIVNGVIVYDPFTPVVDVLQIGGWQLDFSALFIDPDSTTAKLKLRGTGVLSGNGFSDTAATWTFSAQNASSYSMSITAHGVSVAEPAVLALLALGCIGLGVGQRIRGRNKPSL